MADIYIDVNGLELKPLAVADYDKQIVIERDINLKEALLALQNYIQEGSKYTKFPDDSVIRIEVGKDSLTLKQQSLIHVK